MIAGKIARIGKEKIMERNENGLNVLFEGQRGAGRDGGGCSDARDERRTGAREGGRMRNCPSGDGMQLAMVYSPFQCFRMTYAPKAALMRGTLFEELDKPLEEY